MEKRNLYTKDKKLTGEFVFKGDKIPKNRYYLTVMVWIQNSKNKFLLQKTSLQKENKWSTTGGHPKIGESSLLGIVTEIKEELGIKIDANSLKLFKTVKTKDDFVDLYYLKSNINIKNIKVQKEEVEKAQWFIKEEVDDLIKNKEFLPTHIKFYYDFLLYLKKLNTK